MCAVYKGSSRKVLVAASFAPEACIRGVIRYAREQNWHISADMMFTGSIPQEWKGDGVIAHLTWQSESFANLREMRLPCVSLNNSEGAGGLPCVESNHAEIGRMAADYFLQQAHRSFAWAPSLDDDANRERFDAFVARLAEHGQTCVALPVPYTRVSRFCLNNWTSYRRLLAAELQRLPRPAAVFAFDDCVAANLIDVSQDAGLCVPDDLAVLGVGNSIACDTSTIPLSSVDDNIEEVGYRAAMTLDSLMNGATMPGRRLLVSPKGIVTRLSTGIVAVKDPRVARALSFIAEHYPDPMLSVNSVAGAVNMSRRNLERCFRDETGCSINEHIIGVRMREASRILRTHPRAKSSEVAALVGIAGAGTFFRAFRRFFGVSPKAHRDWTGPMNVTDEAEPGAGSLSGCAAPTGEGSTAA